MTLRRSPRSERPGSGPCAQHGSAIAARSLRRRFATLSGVLCILSAGAFGSASAAEWKPAPNPVDCPSGYRCLTIADYGRMTEIKVRLEEDLAAARSRRPRIVEPFVTVGVERLLLEDAAYPYLMTGIRIWRINGWIGVVGKDPAVGIGYTF